MTENDHRDPSHKDHYAEFLDDRKFLKEIADSSPAIIYVLDLNRLEFLYVNRRVSALLGVDETTIFAQGKDIFKQLIHPDDLEVCLSHLRSITSLRDMDVKEHDCRLHVEGNGFHWCRISSRVFRRNDAGLPVQSIGFIQDIHESKLAAIELKKIQDKNKQDAHFISQIVETTPDLIYIMDLNTKKLIYSNRRIGTDLGYSGEEIEAMNNPLLDLMFEDDIPPFLDHLKKMKSLSSDDEVLEIEYRLKNADGGWNTFCDRNSVFKRNARHTPVEQIGICQDITKKLSQEERITTSDDIPHQAEEVTEMGSWEYDILTGEFKWSDGMYKLFNLPLKTPVSPDIYAEYTSDSEKEKVHSIIRLITRDYRSFEEVISIFRHEGEKRIIRIKAVLIRGKKRQPIKMIGVDLDITNQVQAQHDILELNRSLIESNREMELMNTELKTFNSVTSRDFKDTLQTLYTNLEFITNKDSRNLSDASKANIRRAQSAIQRMKLLTDDIGTYLKLYDMGINKEQFDPNPILDTLLNDLKEKLEQLNASVERTQLPDMSIDPFLFRQLMAELVNNALKFRKLAIPPVVKIRYSRADELNSMLQAKENNPYIIISVSDNGIGFREEDTDKVFELFYRLDQEESRYRGSGIGLAVCKKIMSMHGGFITAESQPAVGTVMHCFFPVTEN